MDQDAIVNIVGTNSFLVDELLKEIELVKEFDLSFNPDPRVVELLQKIKDRKTNINFNDIKNSEGKTS